LSGAAAHLEDVAAVEIAQQSGMLLVETFRAPDESVPPEEVSVLGEIGRGGAVPPPTVGAYSVESCGGPVTGRCGSVLHGLSVPTRAGHAE
jgi:hypothetical protein